jgi:hypothetical protein
LLKFYKNYFVFYQKYICQDKYPAGYPVSGFWISRISGKKQYPVLPCGGSVPLYDEIGDKLRTKHGEKSFVLVYKYSLIRNNTISSIIRTQYTPDFFVAEYCTIVCGTPGALVL